MTVKNMYNIEIPCPNNFTKILHRLTEKGVFVFYE